MDRGGPPHAESKANAKNDDGKTKTDDSAKQGGACVLGETVISFSSDVSCKPELKSGNNFGMRGFNSPPFADLTVGGSL